MTAFFADVYPIDKKDPSDFDVFFDKREDLKKISSFSRERECPIPGFPPSCIANLFFGFFFDGTNNNLKRDAPLHAHSNVARLYRAFPGGKDAHGSDAWPELETTYHKSFFRTYVPGVGTRFDEVGDSGEGFSPFTSDRARGLAFAYKGENRIIWALVEAVNNVYRYYTDTPLVDAARFKKDFNKLNLPGGVRPSSVLTAAFTGILEELHDKLKPFVPADMPAKSRDKGQVQEIFVSMFGFSRGAAQARAFANWFIWLCQLDAQLSNRQAVKNPRTLSLGTINVTFDFLGLFDTVASVGLAASAPLLGFVADGHGAWSDTEVSLRIPTKPGPAQCLHLVSAHEVRRSFPLDSVAHFGNTPPNCKEMVFPGVHSDIGGGYSPLDQGRGTDPQGGDLISRITLATMYRAARLAGAPLKLESAPEQIKQAFRIDPRAIAIFNAYVGYCHAQAGAQPPLRLHNIMEFQHRLYIQWRKKMLGKMLELPNVRDLPTSYKSGKFDLTDITMADQELQQEVAKFEAWKKRRERIENSTPGNPEWIPIAKYWDQAPPPPEVTDLFELFVHDSRAWFKPLGKDIPDLWYALESLTAQEEKARDWENSSAAGSGNPNPYALTDAEKRKLLLYKRVKGTDHEMDAIDPDPTGRENGYMGGGYLRFRRIYMGSDSFKPMGAQYAGLAPAGPDGQRGEAIAQRHLPAQREAQKTA